MVLFIDTSQKDRIKIKIDSEEFEVEVEKVKSQALLPLIKKALEKSQKTIHDIKKIELNSGPGSFTGLRVGLTVASTISLLLGLPVNSKFPARGDIVKINYANS